MDDVKVARVNNIVKKITIVMIPIIIILIYAGLNEYISLGKDYIVASSISLVPNRKEYSCSDIKILEDRHKSGSVNNVTYGFEFPDGRKTYGISSNDIAFIRTVQGKQRELGLKVSEPELWIPKGKPNSFFGFLVF